MSRHRFLHNIIKEAYAGNFSGGTHEEHYEEEEEDYNFAPVDEAAINEVLAIFGEEFDKRGVVQALREASWNQELAMNLILNKPNKYKKKTNAIKPSNKETNRTQKPKKKGPNQGQKKNPNEDFPGLPGKENREETKTNNESKKKKDGAEEVVSDSEIKMPKAKTNPVKFVNKSKFNDPLPDLNINLGKFGEVKESKNLSVIICGNVDSGKSTLTGHLLYNLGLVDKKLMRQYEKQSEEQGKGSFKYAWIMDERADERKRGITIEVGMKQIQTANKNITLLDAPGHRDFIANMIGGTAQADVALLVVDANPNAFSHGLNGGQTKEHAILARSMGIEHIIVAINKLDSIEWSEKPYDSIVEVLEDFLEGIGFKEANITMVPISGLEGDNVFTRSKREALSWYTGPCLIELLDEINLVGKNMKKPLRMVINSVFNATSGQLKGLCFSGRIEHGIVEKGKKYVVMPACGEVTVKDILIDQEKKKFAVPGDNVTLSIDPKDSDVSNLKYGSILCHINYPIALASKFNAEIEIFEFERPLLRGETTLMHIGLNKVLAVISKIHHTINKEDGQILKKNPRFLTKGDLASVDITCEKSVCLELFQNAPLFGRVILREKDHTIAAGVIQHILD